MRLAVFTNQFPGPVSTFFARDMRGLIDAGIDIDVFAIYPYDPALWRYVPDILNENILARSKIHHLTISECLYGTSIRPSKELARFLRDSLSIGASAIRDGMGSFAKTMYVLMKAWTWSLRYRDQYDHVLAYWGNYAGSCAYVFHRLSAQGVPFSLFLHASIDLYNESVSMYDKLKYADNIITCSDFNRAFISQRFSALDTSISNKIYVHYHGLDFSRFPRATGNRSTNTLIAVGRFAKQKGFDYLLHALRELKDRGVSVELELVGDGEEAASLRSLARELNITDRVRFHGWLPADDVPGIIAQATVLVHPSPELGDGVPNVIKEAMAVGTPVIGSRIAGIPELLDGGKCGILVTPKDVGELANAIETMLRKEDLRYKYVDAALKRAKEKFDLGVNGHDLASRLQAVRTSS